MKKVSLCLCMMVFCHVFALGQINITSANYNTISFNETNLLQALVLNSGNSVQVTAVATCKNSGGETIIEATSKPFVLSPGMNSISGMTIGFSRMVYGSSAQALYLKNNGVLPSGNFVYCLRINPVANGESSDVFCEEFGSSADDFLSLVSPYDKDTLDNAWPVLTWTHSEPFSVLAQNEYFKIVVTEIKKDQSPEQSVFSNPVVFSKSFLNSHGIPYPQDARELEAGKQYAWQVQKFSNNVLVNKTDVWSFILRDKKSREPLKYVLLKTTPDNSVYTCIDDKIYFRYEEKYDSPALKYTVTGADQKVYDQADVYNDKANGKQEPRLKNTGTNLFELDLSVLNLKKGFYTLTILNEKNKTSFLNFKVEE